MLGQVATHRLLDGIDGLLLVPAALDQRGSDLARIAPGERLVEHPLFQFGVEGSVAHARAL
jgi:hypothetical protein